MSKSKSNRDSSEDRRLGGATRGAQRTARDQAGKSKHVGRPPAGKHRKGD